MSFKMQNHKYGSLKKKNWIQSLTATATRIPSHTDNNIPDGQRLIGEKRAKSN